HPNEILTEKSPGCWFREKYWAVQCASFPSKWKAGDTCIILFQDNKGNKLGEARVVLTYDPADKITIQNFESPRAIPKDVGLSTNFPNPFNARTIIPYHLDRRIPIRLSVINIRGEEIRILYNGFKEAGHHQIHWDGLDGKGTAMPSGMYMLRLQWNNNFDIQKLMLIR
ncbi:FlgD immunoglobulin-like domain containing protein, partial [bacterium]